MSKSEGNYQIKRLVKLVGNSFCRFLGSWTSLHSKPVRPGGSKPEADFFFFDLENEIIYSFYIELK